MLNEITCIAETCKTNAYWIGSIVGQVIIIGIIPAAIYLVYRKYKKKKSKNDSSDLSEQNNPGFK